MLMVILGAGASYDSLARGPPGELGSQWRPPLANELFHPRWGPYITLFPQAASLITDLEKPEINVEGELEKIQNDATQYPRLLVPLTAIRYYLQSMLSSCQGWWEGETRRVTNYHPLLLPIDRWVKGEKVLVSFNYDTLLEGALTSTLGIRFDSMADYVSGNYKIIKPHGSINWWHRVDSPQFPSPISIPDDRIPVVIEKAQELKISPVFELSTPTRAIKPGIPTIPALALPVATKSDMSVLRTIRKYWLSLTRM